MGTIGKLELVRFIVIGVKQTVHYVNIVIIVQVVAQGTTMKQIQ